MPLVTLRNLSLRFRGPPLLDDVTCHIEAGQRIGLLGRNGAGKTSLMRLVAGVIQPDAGAVDVAPGATVALLQQDVPQDVTGTVHDIVATGLPVDSATGDAEAAESGWQREQAVAQILSRMGLDGAAAFASLSAGMKRRVLLARAVVAQPDLLLLDEPTNHLDIEAVEWLETFLGRWRGTLMFVTHDRTFLRHMADRILEIDRGRIFDWSCDYDTFLVRKDEALAAEEKHNARSSSATTSSPPKPEATKKKRSFKEQRELDSLPALIETLETELAAMHAAMAEPDYYRQPGDLLARDQTRLRELESRLAMAFARWESLEAGGA